LGKRGVKSQGGEGGKKGKTAAASWGGSNKKDSLEGGTKMLESIERMGGSNQNAGPELI